MPLCCIKSCPNNSRVITPAIFYIWPKADETAKIWNKVLEEHISNAKDFSKALICGIHFDQDAYEPFSKKLKEDAIPTLFLTKFEIARLSQQTEVDTESEDEGTAPKKHKIMTERHGEENSIKGNSDLTVIEHAYSKKGTSLQSTSELQNALANLKQLNINLTTKYNHLLDHEESLDVELDRLKFELSSKTAELHSLPDKQIAILSKCFSPAQIKMIRGQMKTRWTKDDLAVAYTILHLSSREFYRYLGDNLKIPLPSVSNIVRSYRGKNNDNFDCNEVKVEIEYNTLDTDE